MGICASADKTKPASPPNKPKVASPANPPINPPSAAK